MNSGDFAGSDSRRYERANVPGLQVAFRGHTYDTQNWSMGGLLIGGYDGTCTTGALLTVERIGVKGGKMETVEIRSRVVRVDAERRTLVINFLDIDERGYELLQGFMAIRAAEAEEANKASS